MPEIVSDGDIFQTPDAAANEIYSRATNPGAGSFFAATLGDGPAAALGRAVERGTQAGASALDRALLVTGVGAAAAAGAPIAVPDPEVTPTLPADVANDRFAPRDVSGKIVPITDQPMPEGLARIVGRQKTEELDREGVYRRFAETHSGITNFAAGQVASLLDPLNASMLFMPGVGGEALAARLGGGFLARTAGRVVGGAATGALFAAPEAGLKAVLDPEEATDYGMRDALRDILYSAAGLAIFHTGIGTGLDLLRGDLRPNRIVPGEEPEAPVPGPLDAATQNAVMRSTVSQVVEGRPVDTGDFFYQPPRAETAVGLAMAAREPGIERGEIIAAPDVEAQARRIAPEAFVRYDPLVERANQLRAVLADPEATFGPQIDQRIAELQARAEQLRAEQVMPAGATPEEVRARIAEGTAAYEAAAREADALARGRAGMIAARLEAARAEFAAVDAQMRDIAATGELARARSQAEATLSAAAASRRVVMGPRPRLPAASEGTARPARPVGERPGVTPPTPTVVDSAGFRQQIAAAGGDMSKAGDALVARVEQELARGAQVAYVIGDRRVPIVAIDRGMLADAQGQRWGLMQLTSAGNRLEIRPPVESLPTTNLIELALRQQAMAREGWAPGVSRDELAGANDAVYGKPKGEPAAPTPAPQAPGTEQAATAGATPEEALLEQQIAQLPPGALHPEDQAELAKSAEAIAEAGTMRSAFETAASCLLGLIG